MLLLLRFFLPQPFFNPTFLFHLLTKEFIPDDDDAKHGHASELG